MIATDSAPVASPSEGHPGPARKQQKGSDGAEFSEGRPKGAERREAVLLPFLDPYRSEARTGPQRLAEFGRAPAAVQERFWRALQREVEKAQAIDLRVFCESGLSPAPAVTFLRWNQDWRDRAYNVRLREERGTRDNGFDAADAEDLKRIEAAVYVEELTDQEPNRAGFIRCPLPGHEERTGSFHAKGTTWRCFGCGQHGTIYDLASALWDLPMRGAGFIDLHRQLMERFG